MELSILDEDRWGAGEHTGHWWAQARDIRERVLRLPFLRQLADGSLDPGAFAEYLQQDAFYLAEYSRALALLAARRRRPRRERSGGQRAHGRRG
ncbi:hypothetical protein A5N15_09005 [Rothia kristinae]|uniref:Thiaminase-2/PQQC domain-containing protein n=1 Tax=Rothia kristinae TaxID=37923 RepID=A0A657IW10_9MICC|nr:hypothetical protein A5N15_09005 [Rothia kristinae]